MGKKDFSSSTENVFDDFFTQPVAIKKKEEVKEVKTKPADEKKEVSKVKKVIEKKEITENIKAQEPAITPKTHSKDKRYNFFVDNELSEYVSNITWIKRQKNVATYINSLIRADLLDLLNLPKDSSDEELVEKWEQYKKENNL